MEKLKISSRWKAVFEAGGVYPSWGSKGTAERGLGWCRWGAIVLRDGWRSCTGTGGWKLKVEKRGPETKHVAGGGDNIPPGMAKNG